MVYSCKTASQGLKLSTVFSSRWEFIVIILEYFSFKNNDKYSKGSNLMELKYFVVKEEVQKQKVLIKHISTKLMIADLLTKGLSPKTFNDYVKCMGINRYHYWNKD